MLRVGPLLPCNGLLASPICVCQWAWAAWRNANEVRKILKATHAARNAAGRIQSIARGRAARKAYKVRRDQARVLAAQPGRVDACASAHSIEDGCRWTYLALARQFRASTARVRASVADIVHKVYMHRIYTCSWTPRQP